MSAFISSCNKCSLLTYLFSWTYKCLLSKKPSDLLTLLQIHTVMACPEEKEKGTDGSLIEPSQANQVGVEVILTPILLNFP